MFLVFLCLGIVGLVVLAFAALFGGEHDFGHDLGGGHDGGDSGPGIFSAKTASAFLTAFGLSGAVAIASNLSLWPSIGIGVGAGLAFGFVAFQIINVFHKQEATSSLATEELLGQKGEVITTIPATGRGEIRVHFSSETRTFLAGSADGESIPPGTTVEIVSTSGMIQVRRVKG